MQKALINSATKSGKGETPSRFPLRFTGDAIQYVSASQMINLNEWQWHEEMINGQQHCVITDRLFPEKKLPVS